MARLIDLDELALRCHDKRARAYLEEAIACYNAGAFRSCIVSTWNSVVFDYLHKLSELSQCSNQRAGEFLQTFENIRKGGESSLKDALEFERTVLDNAEKEFVLFTPLEKIDLKRLFEDRNRCAHPSMQSVEAPYQPSAELARTHLRNAVEILLERNPVQGRAIEQMMFSEVSGYFFPEDRSKALAYLKEGPMVRVRDSVVRNMIIGLTKK